MTIKWNKQSKIQEIIKKQKKREWLRSSIWFKIDWNEFYFFCEEHQQLWCVWKNIILVISASSFWNLFTTFEKNNLNFFLSDLSNFCVAQIDLKIKLILIRLTNWFDFTKHNLRFVSIDLKIKLILIRLTNPMSQNTISIFFYLISPTSDFASELTTTTTTK